MTHAGLELDARLGDSSALAARLFAFFGGEGLEKGLEARVAAIDPVKLAVTAQSQLALSQASRPASSRNSACTDDKPSPSSAAR